MHSVDQYLNIKLTDISVTDPDKYPHMVCNNFNLSNDFLKKNIINKKKIIIRNKNNFQLSVKNCFIRGSVVRYVQLPGDEVDTQLLQDAARKEAAVQAR